MQRTRRSLLKSVGAATVVGSVSSGVATAGGDNEGRSDGIIYKDEHGRIVQIGPHSYILAGAESEKDFEFLIDKRDELLTSDSSGVSIASHSESGVDSAGGFYDGKEYGVQSDFEAQADNGRLEVGGNCEGSWWSESWEDDYIEAQLTLTFESTVSYNGNSLSVGLPPGGNWTSGNDKATARLTDEYPAGEHFPGMYVAKGSLTWEADCFDWVAQDNRVKFDFQNGDTQYAGTYIKLHIGHCGI